MAMRVHCPHCFRVLLVVDVASGVRRQCPGCGELFDVPRFAAAEQAGGPSPPTQCPRCKADVGVSAAFCHACYTDLKTGLRLSLVHRLRLRSWRFWVLSGTVTVTAALLVLVVAQFITIHSRRVAVTFQPTTARTIPAAELAAALLTARDAAERRAACDALRGVEQRAAPAIAAALEASRGSGVGNAETRGNRIAAIDILARSGPANPEAVPRWQELFADCQQDPSLREAALRARAILGDARVGAELIDAWLDRLERRMLLAAVVRAARSENEPGARDVLRQAEANCVRLSEGLRALAASEPDFVFGRLAEAYWDSWSWLGQGGGEQMADEVFDLARPTGRTLEFEPEDVRQPRDVLKRTAAQGSPKARAAAGLILEQRGPQYRTLARTVGESLAAALPSCTPPEQQLVAWAAARLCGKTFGSGGRRHPRDVTPDDVASAVEWARPGARVVEKALLPSPPVVVRRVLTVASQMERDLVAELQAGFAPAWRAVDQWRAAGLGCTAHIRELVHPGQRQPNYAALAAALVIVADANDTSVRRELELWRTAAEQPAWVRALAYMVLGSLDARRDRWESGWPARLDLGTLDLLDQGTPGWDAFGRVLAAGGPAMRQRLLDFRPAPLAPPVQARLLEAAKRTADRPATLNPPS